MLYALTKIKIQVDVVELLCENFARKLKRRKVRLSVSFEKQQLNPPRSPLPSCFAKFYSSQPVLRKF